MYGHGSYVPYITAAVIDPDTCREQREWRWFEAVPLRPGSTFAMLGPQHPDTGRWIVSETFSGGGERGARFFVVDPLAEVPSDLHAPPAVRNPAPVLQIPLPRNQFYWTKDELGAFELDFSPTAVAFDDSGAAMLELAVPRAGSYRVFVRARREPRARGKSSTGRLVVLLDDGKPTSHGIETSTEYQWLAS